MLPIETLAHVVLRQQDVPGLPPVDRLMLLHPEDLGRREAWQCFVPGDLEQAVSSVSLPDHLALGTGSLVVPQEGRTNDLAALVQQD